MTKHKGLGRGLDALLGGSFLRLFGRGLPE